MQPAPCTAAAVGNDVDTCPGEAQKDVCGATAAVTWQDNGHKF